VTESIVGRVGLVYGANDIAARIIRVVTHSPIHHSIIDLGDGTCASAELKSIERLPLSQFPNVIWVEPGTPEQRQSAAWFAASMIGHAYNRPAFVLAGLDALHLVPGLLRKPLDDWATEYGFTCSGLVVASFNAANADWPTETPTYTSPADLAHILGVGAEAVNAKG
jgi:hypothetical protein